MRGCTHAAAKVRTFESLRIDSLMSFTGDIRIAILKWLLHQLVPRTVDHPMPPSPSRLLLEHVTAIDNDRQLRPTRVRSARMGPLAWHCGSFGRSCRKSPCLQWIGWAIVFSHPTTTSQRNLIRRAGQHSRMPLSST